MEYHAVEPSTQELIIWATRLSGECKARSMRIRIEILTDFEQTGDWNFYSAGQQMGLTSQAQLLDWALEQFRNRGDTRGLKSMWVRWGERDAERSRRRELAAA